MNVYKLRNIERSVAFSDKFTQHTFNDAKQMFEEATISYQCYQCQIEWVVLLVFQSLDNKFRWKVGYSDELLEQKVELMKAKVSTLPPLKRA